MQALRLAVLSATLVLSGCLYLPLGGVAVGQGGPRGSFGVDLGGGMGSFANLQGLGPEVRTRRGRLLNPVPDDSSSYRTVWLHVRSDSLLAGSDLVDLVDLSARAGLTTWLDVGVSLARGGFAVVKLADRGPLHLSVSPAFFRRGERVVAGDADDGWETYVRNVNVTALLAWAPGRGAARPFEAYAGLGLNAVRTEVRTGGDVGRFDGRMPTGLLGLSATGSAIGAYLEAEAVRVTPRSGGPLVVHTARAGLRFPLARAACKLDLCGG